MQLKEPCRHTKQNLAAAAGSGNKLAATVPELPLPPMEMQAYAFWGFPPNAFGLQQTTSAWALTIGLGVLQLLYCHPQKKCGSYIILCEQQEYFWFCYIQLTKPKQTYLKKKFSLHLIENIFWMMIFSVVASILFSPVP